jgi:GH35 family endo-1,4-beta-xylanase
MNIQKIPILIFFAGLFAACMPASTSTPIEAAINTPLPAETAIATPEPTATPVTFIEGLDNVPEPDDDFVDQVVSENYLRVMGLAREQVQIVYREHHAASEESFVVMLDETTGVPLAVYTDEWEKSTLKFFGRQVGIAMGTDTADEITPAELAVMREFERGTIAAGNYWAENEPARGEIDEYHRERIDAITDDLLEAGISDIVAHGILYGYPDWLVDGEFSKDELREIMRARIQFAIDNNPHATLFVVVNEPYVDENEWRERDPFYRAWGSHEYIVEAFQMARDYASAKNRAIQLIYNDQDNHYQIGSTSAISRRITTMLYQKGLIDYVGMQTHIGEWRPNAFDDFMLGQMPAEFAYYKNLGVPVLITELTYQPDPNYLLSEATHTLSPEELEARLSFVFGEVVRIAVESGNVRGITFWGLTDKWFKMDDVNWYMIFDEDGQPKQSYYAVLRALYAGLPVPASESADFSTDPQSLDTVSQLSAWLDEFTHAYGGTVTVNGLVLDAPSLHAAILANPDEFTKSKIIAGQKATFLLVNDIPIAMRLVDGVWQEASMARLSEMANATFEFSPRIVGDRFSEYTAALQRVAGRGARFTFPGEMDTCSIYNDFTPQDWRDIIENWEQIQSSLNAGEVPTGYPYKWDGVYQIMDFATTYVEEPQFRAQHLVESRLNYCMLAESIIQLWERERFSKEEMLKVLEFVVRTRVLQFPTINDWTVQDEMISAHIQWTNNGNNRYQFWINATGKTPQELTLLAADWVKRDNPNARTYVTEDNLLDFSNPISNALRRAFKPYIEAIALNNLTDQGAQRVDYIVSENNLSVHYPLQVEQMQAQIDAWRELGLTVGSAETMIYIDQQSIRESLTLGSATMIPPSERFQVQAEMYRQLLTLYLQNDVLVFGLGGIDDYNAWTNDTGWRDTEPLLFDDDLRAKPAYYAIVQVLYERIP